MTGRILSLAEAPRRARIIVCGGRDYGMPPYDLLERAEAERAAAQERAFLFATLDALDPEEIAHGAATGADSLAGEWAELRGRPCQRFPALWKVHGRKRAGPIRNRRMFADFAPSGVISFRGGFGTADMETVAIDGGAWLVRSRR